MNKLHFEWRVKAEPPFWGKRDYPNVGMGEGSLSPNLYLAPDSICSRCTRDRRQAVDQSCFRGFFFGHCGPPPRPPPRPWDEDTV